MKDWSRGWAQDLAYLTDVLSKALFCQLFYVVLTTLLQWAGQIAQHAFNRVETRQNTVSFHHTVLMAAEPALALGKGELLVSSQQSPGEKLPSHDLALCSSLLPMLPCWCFIFSDCAVDTSVWTGHLRPSQDLCTQLGRNTATEWLLTCLDSSLIPGV